ncbi:unnamed protein product, partial [Closterium sp. NIES-54]
SVVSLCLVLSRTFALLVVFLVRVLLLSPAHTLWHFLLPLFHCVFLYLLLLSPLFLRSLTLSLTALMLLVPLFLVSSPLLSQTLPLSLLLRLPLLLSCLTLPLPVVKTTQLLLLLSLRLPILRPSGVSVLLARTSLRTGRRTLSLLQLLYLVSLPCCLPLRETRMHQTSRPRALTQRRLRVLTPLSG